MPVDFYELLDVDRDAERDDIKQAFRRMAREYHPDVNDDERATAQFTVVRKAYEVLTDEQERADYDRLGHSTYVEKRLDGLRKFKFPGEAGKSQNGSSNTTATSSTARSNNSSRSSGSSRSSSSRSSTSSNRSRGSSSSSRSSSRTAQSSSRRSSSASSSRTSSSTTSSRSSSSRSASRNGSSRSSGRTSSSRNARSSSGSSTGSRTSSRTSSSRRRSSRRARNDDSNRSDSSSTQSAESSQTNPLWYGWSVSLVALVIYFGAVGWFVTTEGSAFVESLLAIDTAAPVPALLASSSLSLPTLAALQTAASASPTTLVLPAASALLALALIGTVAKFGHSWATWLYALAAMAPLALVIAGSVGMVRPLAVDIVALSVLPLLGAGGFVVDAGRYLWAAR